MWAVLTSPQTTTLRPFLSEVVHVVQEGVVELHLVAQAVCGALAVGEVDAEEHEIVEVGDDGAPLAVEALYAEAEADAAGFAALLGVKAHTAVTLSFRRREPRGIPLDLLQGRGQLDFVSLGFLDAQHIGLFLREPFQKTFLVCRPDAVYIPGNQLHILCAPVPTLPKGRGKNRRLRGIIAKATDQ